MLTDFAISAAFLGFKYLPILVYTPLVSPFLRSANKPIVKGAPFAKDLPKAYTEGVKSPPLSNHLPSSCSEFGSSCILDSS